MKVIYYSKIDALSILFNATPITESSVSNPGIIMDYDKDGNLIGLEIIDASVSIKNPSSLEYAVKV